MLARPQKPTFFAFLGTMLLSIGMASAAERLHGTVLAVQAAQQQVIVRHDPFAGMPSMAMPFRVPDRAALAKLRPGNGIEAEVDLKTEPWTLRNVRIAGDQAPTGNSMFRTSKRVQLGDQMPATAFVDQRGRAFTFDELRGKYVVTAFIYTRCRDPRMCPLISAKFAQLQGMLGRNARLVEVTLDPDYDRPSVLARYARAFRFRPDRVTLLTGDPNGVLDFAAMFGLSAFADPAYGLIHNDVAVVVDPQGKIAEMISGNSWKPDEIVRAVVDLEHRPADPLARLDLALSKAAVAVCGNAVAGFSGLVDLLVLLAILAAGGWLIVRFARRIARGSV